MCERASVWTGMCEPKRTQCSYVAEIDIRGLAATELGVQKQRKE